MRSDRRVVVTGIGPITAVGVGANALWEGIRREQSGVTEISSFDPTPFRSRLAAEVRDFDPADHLVTRQVKRFDRYSQFAVASARMALEDSGLNVQSMETGRAAVQIGSALGGMAYAEHQLGEYLRGGLRAVDPRLALTTFGGAASCNIAIEFGLTGPTGYVGLVDPCIGVDVTQPMLHHYDTGAGAHYFPRLIQYHLYLSRILVRRLRQFFCLSPGIALWLVHHNPDIAVHRCPHLRFTHKGIE